MPSRLAISLSGTLSRRCQRLIIPSNATSITPIPYSFRKVGLCAKRGSIFDANYAAKWVSFRCKSTNSTFIAVAGTLPIAIGQWCLDHMLGIAGWGFVAAGVAILCYLVYANVRGTNLWYGLGGSVVQIPLLLIASEFIIALAIVGLALWVILSLFGLSAGDSSSISDQQEQEDHDWFMSLNNKDGFWKDKGKS